MSCKGPSSVFDFLDSASPPPETAEFRLHMEQCPDCRNRQQFYSQLRQQTRQTFEGEKLPELSRARLMKALLNEGKVAPAPKPVVSPWRMWGSGLAAAAGFMLFSSLALFQGPATKSTNLTAALASDHARSVAGKQEGPAHPEIDPAQVAQTTFGSAPEVASFPNLERVDCRICPIDKNHRAVHVLYRSPSSKLVSMFELPAENPNELDLPESAQNVEPHVLSNPDHNMVAWRHAGWMHFLVSEMAPNKLAQIARDGRYLASNRRWSAGSPNLGPQQSPYDGLAQPASFQHP